MKRSKQHGFTLIELMIVVAIIGILAAVAIPAFLEYMNSGKGSEGDIAINHLEKNAKAYYVKKADYPQGNEAPTPAAACCNQAGKVCAAVAGDWNLANPGHPWSDLKFEMTDNGFRFQYDYTGNPGAFTAHGIADLDCDGGGKTTITSTGTSTNGTPAASHVTTGDD
jgi:prepilin-type N-terminal cleavage/methylation domain-containing protein